MCVIRNGTAAAMCNPPAAHTLPCLASNAHVRSHAFGHDTTNTVTVCELFTGKSAQTLPAGAQNMAQSHKLGSRSFANYTAQGRASISWAPRP